MRISDWSSDVCSSDLVRGQFRDERAEGDAAIFLQLGKMVAMDHGQGVHTPLDRGIGGGAVFVWRSAGVQVEECGDDLEVVFHPVVEFTYHRSEERRVGKEFVSTCRSRRRPDFAKKNTQLTMPVHTQVT